MKTDKDVDKLWHDIKKYEDALKEKQLELTELIGKLKPKQCTISDVVKRTLDRKIAAYELVKMWFEKEYNTGTDRDELNEMEREAADLNSQIKVLRFMLAEVEEH